MLTFEERRQLTELMQDQSEGHSSSIDVSHRFRDEKGRFLSNLPEAPEVSRSRSVKPPIKVRPIKLKQVRGSYRSYHVRTRWLSTDEKIYLFGFLGFVALAIAF
jgi:hypothetical protein